MTTTLSTPPRRRMRRNWLQRQFLLFEVTFGSFVMSPGEKLAFYAFLILFLTFLTTTVALYLPLHLRTIFRRLVFYLFGDDGVRGDVLGYPYNAGFVEVLGHGNGNMVVDKPPGVSIGHGEVKSYMG
ncbi:hypothetical protein TWF481_010787 [Arthrobotrys musiformis]|uniref:Pseudouridine synthase RsuA/RluA-like domain-containing protein n=1 Tax=Arthrobotrys musiformis TaxID=47236 RepID=A0AAV9W3S8_9PEZI